MHAKNDAEKKKCCGACSFANQQLIITIIVISLCGYLFLFSVATVFKYSARNVRTKWSEKDIGKLSWYIMMRMGFRRGMGTKKTKERER